mmetsp:Transcript_6819/g.15739  ORF Transcript_6819/g.15739 Transcript_6819/m.15739 type:complete len:253 (+) Transcript_6819:1121-1879(+)
MTELAGEEPIVLLDLLVLYSSKTLNRARAAYARRGPVRHIQLFVINGSRLGWGWRGRAPLTFGNLDRLVGFQLWWDFEKEISERANIAESLQHGVHVAGIAKVSHARLTLLCDWSLPQRLQLLVHRFCSSVLCLGLDGLVSLYCLPPGFESHVDLPRLPSPQRRCHPIQVLNTRRGFLQSKRRIGAGVLQLHLLRPEQVHVTSGVILKHPKVTVVAVDALALKLHGEWMLGRLEVVQAVMPGISTTAIMSTA